jgi:hypothetical protein
VNVVASSDRAAGASIAPNTPWHARAATSIVNVLEAPPTADATAKPARPVMNMTFRPSRSARRPPNSSRLPNDSAYAVTTHCRSAFEKLSACCADGSAMFITVASSTTMSWAIAMTTRVIQRLESGPGVIGSVISVSANLEDVSPFLDRDYTKRRKNLRSGRGADARAVTWKS